MCAPTRMAGPFLILSKPSVSKLPDLINLLICGISPIVCPSMNQCCDVSLLISSKDLLGKTIFKCFFTRLL